MKKIKVMIVEDDIEWARGITAFLNRQDLIEVTCIASSGEECLSLVRHDKQSIDVILMDIMMANGAEGIWATAEITRTTNIKVIMLTSLGQQHMVAEAFAAGATDYVLKDNFASLPNNIEAVFRNFVQIDTDVIAKLRDELIRLKKMEENYRSYVVKNLLTPTEVKVLQHICNGQTQTQIATLLYVSINTVKVHVSNILKKLESKNSKEATVKARQLGIV